MKLMSLLPWQFVCENERATIEIILERWLVNSIYFLYRCLSVMVPIFFSVDLKSAILLNQTSVNHYLLHIVSVTAT